MIKRKAILGIVLVLVIVAAGTIWIVKPMLSPKTGAVHTVSTPSYSTLQRSDEIPLVTHHMQSSVAMEGKTMFAPWGVTVDQLHGFVWVAEPGCEPTPKCPSLFQGGIGQYAFSDGNFIANFTVPVGYSSPLFVAVDKQGDIWFTQPTSDAIGEFDPVKQNWNTWPVKKGSAPFDLTFDAQGNIWFTEFATSSIGFFNTSTHTVVETPTPTANSDPYGITMDHKGTIWFAENGVGASQIGSFTSTVSGSIKITEHAVNTLRPHMITVDKAGLIWYSGGFHGDIGRYDPASDNSIDFPAHSGTAPTHISGIAIDGAGNIWFSDSLSQYVGYLIPATGQIIVQTLNANAHPYDGLVVDSSNRVWFTAEFALTITMWPTSQVH